MNILLSGIFAASLFDTRKEYHPQARRSSLEPQRTEIGYDTIRPQSPDLRKLTLRDTTAPAVATDTLARALRLPFAYKRPDLNYSKYNDIFVRKCRAYSSRTRVGEYRMLIEFIMPYVIKATSHKNVEIIVDYETQMTRHVSFLAQHGDKVFVFILLIGDARFSHKCGAIYKNAHLWLFDPYGKANTRYKNLVDAILAAKLPLSVIHQPDETSTNLQCESGAIRQRGIDPVGYCVSWTWMFFDHVCLNPEFDMMQLSRILKNYGATQLTSNAVRATNIDHVRNYTIFMLQVTKYVAMLGLRAGHAHFSTLPPDFIITAIKLLNYPTTISEKKLVAVYQRGKEIKTF